MKRYVIHQASGIDSLTLEDAPSSVAAYGQVVVRVRATSLNYRDTLVVSGNYGRGMKTPLVPLSDGAGEVIAVGEGVTRVRVGDRVAGIFFQTWTGGRFEYAHTKSALGGAVDGMLAEEVVLSEEGLVLIPDHLSFEEAATLPCAAVTAWNALFGGQPVLPGQSVLTLGSGGVSVFAIQFAKLVGATVVSTSSSDSKLEFLRELGATHLINYVSRPDWDVAVREVTGGAGVDHVVEIGGGGTLPLSTRAIGYSGTVSLIGVLTKGEADASPYVGKGATLRGIYVGSRQHFEAMNRAISAAKLKPIIDRVFPFGEAKEAYRHLQSGSHVGKVVISVD